MKLRSGLCLLCCLMLLFACAARAQESVDSAALYEKGLLLIRDESYASAASLFSGLGDFRESAKYAQYALAMMQRSKHNPSQARKNFTALEGFLDSQDQVTYIDKTCVHRFFDGTHFGYMSLDGTICVPAEWDWAERTPRAESYYQDAGYVVGQSSMMAAAVVFRGSVVNGEDGLTPEEGSYGLISTEGRLLLEAKWREILWAQNGMAAVSDGAKSYVYDLVSGECIDPLGYEGVLALGDNDVLTCQRGSLWGFVGRDGSLIGDGFAWDGASRMIGSRAMVLSKDKAGLVNEKGEMVVAMEYQAFGELSEGLIAYKEANRWGYMDENGKIVVERAYKEAQPFHSGLAGVRKGDKWGVINTRSEFVLQAKYSEIAPVERDSERGWMRLNKRWGMYDLTGNVILKPAYTAYQPFGSDGLASVADKLKYGFIDKQGTLLIGLDYQMASSFRAGRGGVLTDTGEVRYIAKLGGRYFTVQSDKPYDCVYGFIEGIKKADPLTGSALKYTVYDVSGKEIQPH